MKFFKNIFYSFAVQLLLMHLKKQYVLLLFWVIMVGFFTGKFGIKLGIPYLFFDPEYLGRTDFISFTIYGFAFGGFLMTWNITTYILNSYRFSFLATLRRPFTKFCMNNFILPLIVVVIYIIGMIQFQIGSEFKSFSFVLIHLLGGFFSGFILFLLLTFLYFFNTNIDIFGLMGIARKDVDSHRRDIQKKSTESQKSRKSKNNGWRVDTYLSTPFRIRRTRSTAHYSDELMNKVFRQNHANALIIEFIALLTLLLLGLLIDYPVFRIPAAASVLLLFSILIMLAGALAFWMRGWRALVFIVIILSVNYMMKFELFNHKNKAFGLNYSVDKVAYNHLKLEELSTISIIENDKISYFETLNNWKAKFPGDKKPKMIFINVSGGGLRSTVWTLKVLQKADSMLKGELLNHTTLITGASGGMIGAAYYRELYLRKLNGDSIDLNSMEYLNNVSRDLLNSILFTAVVNDLFFPIQKYRIGDYSYTIDRGYSFEMQLNENTDYILDKSIGSYVEDEKLMRIPSMIMNPVITNDARYLFISSLPVSFLTRPFYKYGVQSHSNIDGVEFTRLLVNHDPYNLKFTSALRMNASFPYITPNAVLPTWPELEIVDAGIRNNYGVETAVRFLFVFREWIAKNTDGVVFLQIRDLPKRLATENKKRETVLDKIMNPIGDAYVNLQAFQDFSNESLTESVEIWFDGSFDIIELHYVTSNTERRAALSWHLTSREKESIIGAIDQPSNISNLNKLKRLILD